MTVLENILARINDIVWGPPMLALLVGTHLFLTFRTGFIQRYVFEGIRISFGRHKEGEGDISQFASLATALAATIGTGNIVGVATAIASGGPGAVLWMWLTGVFGIATKYSEALLSVKFRVRNAQGQMCGGPMYVLERGMKSKPLAVLFAVFTTVAAFGIGNMVQANSISSMLFETYAIPQWGTGAVITVLTALVVLGGIKSIAKTCERLVPVMAIFYILGCLAVLFIGWKTLPDTIALIVKSAFTGQAAVGGFIGAGMKEAIRFGVARGLFSNESGLGSAPIVAAAAQTKNAVRQALVSSSGTFWDTVVVCALTGLVLVNSGQWMNGHDGAALTKSAFSSIPTLGPLVLSVALLTFVFSTILGWEYFGEKAAEYLWGPSAIMVYRVLWVTAVFIGSVVSLRLVWSFADAANAMMAIPNLISLIVLHSVIVSETKTYFQKEKA